MQSEINVGNCGRGKPDTVSFIGLVSTWDGRMHLWIKAVVVLSKEPKIIYFSLTRCFLMLAKTPEIQQKKKKNLEGVLLLTNSHRPS